MYKFILAQNYTYVIQWMATVEIQQRTMKPGEAEIWYKNIFNAALCCHFAMPLVEIS